LVVLVVEVVKTAQEPQELQAKVLRVGMEVQMAQAVVVAVQPILVEMVAFFLVPLAVMAVMEPHLRSRVLLFLMLVEGVVQVIQQEALVVLEVVVMEELVPLALLLVEL
jgi:hypothetical protein